MAEKQKTLELDLEGKKVTVVVTRATTRAGIQRSLLIFRAFDELKAAEKEGRVLDEVLNVINQRTLPDIVAGTASVTGIPFPPSADDLAGYPEEFTQKWIDAIYEINPHWNPVNFREKTDPEEVKKNNPDGTPETVSEG